MVSNGRPPCTRSPTALAAGVSSGVRLVCSRLPGKVGRQEWACRRRGNRASCGSSGKRGIGVKNKVCGRERKSWRGMNHMHTYLVHKKVPSRSLPSWARGVSYWAGSGCLIFSLVTSGSLSRRGCPRSSLLDSLPSAFPPALFDSQEHFPSPSGAVSSCADGGKFPLRSPSPISLSCVCACVKKSKVWFNDFIRSLVRHMGVLLHEIKEGKFRKQVVSRLFPCFEFPSRSLAVTKKVIIFYRSPVPSLVEKRITPSRLSPSSCPCRRTSCRATGIPQRKKNNREKRPPNGT